MNLNNDVYDDYIKLHKDFKNKLDDLTKYYILNTLMKE